MIAIIMITVFMAMSSAADDDHQIRADRPIHHGGQWMARAFVLVILAWLLDQTWMVLGLWGLFSAVFRFSLNRFRGKDWRDVSISNYYDMVFIVIARGDIQHAGTIAYIVELASFVAVTAWLW